MSFAPVPLQGKELDHLDSTGHGNASAAAEGGESQGFLPLFHGMHQGHHEPCTG